MTGLPDRNPGSRRGRIGYVCQWWSQEAAEGVPGRWAKLLRSLGNDVVVVTGPPMNLHTGLIDDGKSWWRRSQRNVAGFPTAVFPFFPGHSSSTIKRAAMYASFAASASLGGTGILGRTDLNVVYSSPATAAAPAMLSKRLHGVPYVLVVLDLWPDSVFAAGFLREGLVHHAAHACLNAFVNASYREAEHIAVTSEGMKAQLIERGVPEGKLTVIYNWDDTPGGGPLTVPTRKPGTPLRIMYAGNVGPPQGLDNVVRALALLPQEDFHFTVVGGGVQLDSLRALTAGLGLQNVEFVGPVPRAGVNAYLATAHIHVVSLIDDPLFSVTVPSKLQSLMSMGLPVLAVAPGETVDIVRRAGAGATVGPGDPEALASALRRLVHQPDEWFRRRGKDGYRFYNEHMSGAAAARLAAEAVAVEYQSPNRS